MNEKIVENRAGHFALKSIYDTGIKEIIITFVHNNADSEINEKSDTGCEDFIVGG
jgi:hypothetical protein